MTRESFTSAFIIALLVSGLSLLNIMQLSMAEGSTSVGGIIALDTTWTKANNPYTLTSSVLVNVGVTLTIEAGVTVDLNGHILMVNGTLVAKGTNADYIRFNDGKIIFTHFSNGWNSKTRSGSIISNAVMASQISILDSSPMISNSNISYVNNPIEISGGSPIISGNNISAVEYRDNNGVLHMTDIGVFVWNNNTATITDNVIYGPFDKACITVYGGSPIIQRNLIAVGDGIDLSVIAFDYVKPIIQNNTFAYCRKAILTGTSTVALTSTVSYNNFENTTQYSIYWVYARNLDASYNWWGTTNASEIDQKIWDYNDNFNSGRVNYSPFLTAAQNTQPVPNQNASLPKQDNNSTIPKPDLYGIAIIALVAIIVIVLLVAGVILVLRKKKQNP